MRDDLKSYMKQLKKKGDSKIKISIKKDKNYLFELKDKRKFDYESY